MTRVKPPPLQKIHEESEFSTVQPAAAAVAVRVVAVGASAGGLDAFIDLLSSIPAQTGLAFVLVQHLDPRHESMLAGILARAAAIPVQQVTDGMRIERDHIYVIPARPRDDGVRGSSSPRSAHIGSAAPAAGQLLSIVGG